MFLLFRGAFGWSFQVFVLWVPKTLCCLICAEKSCRTIRQLWIVYSVFIFLFILLHSPFHVCRLRSLFSYVGKSSLFLFFFTFSIPKRQGRASLSMNARVGAVSAIWFYDEMILLIEIDVDKWEFSEGCFARWNRMSIISSPVSEHIEILIQFVIFRHKSMFDSVSRQHWIIHWWYPYPSSCFQYADIFTAASCGIQWRQTAVSLMKRCSTLSFF